MTGLVRYVLLRLVQAAVTLWLASIVVCLGILALPGYPARALAGEDPDPATLKAIRAKYGLDQSIWQQYRHYLGRALHGDLGTSIATGQPVTTLLKSALPVTGELALLAILIAIVLGIGPGVLAPGRRGPPRRPPAP